MNKKRPTVEGRLKGVVLSYFPPDVAFTSSGLRGA